MKSRFAILTAVGLFAASMGVPAYVHGLQAQAAPQHDHEHSEAGGIREQPAPRDGMMTMMAAMKAGDARLEELVLAMKAAKGARKTEAMEALLTAIVEERRTTRDAMAAGMADCKMMQMMNMMRSAGAP